MTNPVDISNPFANTFVTPASVQTLIPKASAIDADDYYLTFKPTVPTSYSQYFTTNQANGVINSIQYVQRLVANGTIISFNTMQKTALNATNTYFTAYLGSTPGNLTFDAPNLSNIVIAYSAISELQNTGLLITPQDLANSNVTLHYLTGFAPNGASTVTVHDQHTICEIPNNGTWAASNVGDSTSWNPLSVGVMETYSDQPVAVDQLNGLVIVFR